MADSAVVSEPAAPGAPPAARRPRVRPTVVLALLTAPAWPAVVAPFAAGWHWSIDLLACFPVQATAALFSVAAVLFAVRRWRLGVVYIVGALIGAGAVVPGWLGGDRAPTADSGAKLRLLSLNLLRDAQANAPAALEAVRAADADVVFCSELTPAWLTALAPLETMYPHRFVAPDQGYFGTALFSRLPLRAAESLPLGYEWAPALRAIVATPSGDVGLLGVHTPRPGTGARSRERDRALASIPAAIANLPPARIVLGDFNATPWTHAFVAMVDAAVLEPASTRAFRPTWPSGMPWPLRIPIDHVLLGGGVRLVECSVGEPFGSDHLPLRAEVRLPQR